MGECFWYSKIASEVDDAWNPLNVPHWALLRRVLNHRTQYGEAMRNRQILLLDSPEVC